MVNKNSTDFMFLLIIYWIPHGPKLIETVIQYKSTKPNQQQLKKNSLTIKNENKKINNIFILYLN